MSAAPGSCPSRDILSQFHMGELPTGADAVSAHLDGCAACRSVLDELLAADRSLFEAGSTADFTHRREPGYRRAQNSLLAASADGRPSSPLEPPLPAEYEILEEIGRGGMGTVYRARHLRLDRLVALKIVTPELLSHEAAAARFQREIRAAGRLDHPNVVTTHDAGEIDGRHYLVMELLNGVSLSRLAKEQVRLHVADACELVRQACRGLQHAHTSGILHRDVNLSNLFLCRNSQNEPTVKLLDLGLATFVRHFQKPDGLTHTGQLMGTLEFIAPEQFGNLADVDERADLYSLGVSLFRLLCGRTPWPVEQFETALQMMKTVGNGQPPSAGELRPLPDELVRLIDRLLSPDPAGRPASAGEVASLLAPWAEGHRLSRLIDLRDPAESIRDTSATVLPTEIIRLDSPPDRPERTPPAPPRKTPFFRKAAYALCVAALALLSVPLFMENPRSVLRVQIGGPAIEVRGAGTNAVLAMAGRTDTQFVGGSHSLPVPSGDVNSDTREYPRKSGDVTAVVESLPDAVRVVAKEGVEPGGVTRRPTASTPGLPQPVEPEPPAMVKQPPPPAQEIPSPSDRTAAEWVLAQGGILELDIDGEGPVAVEEAADLPVMPFRLTLVHIQDADVTDADLRNLSGLPHLTKLRLIETKVNCTGLDFLAGSPIREFVLIGRKVPLTSAGAARIAQFRTMTRLSIGDQKISRELLEALSPLSKLQVLDFYSSPVAADAFPLLAGFTELSRLILSRSRPGETEFRELARLPMLKHVLISMPVAEAQRLSLLAPHITVTCRKPDGQEVAVLNGSVLEKQ